MSNKKPTQRPAFHCTLFTLIFVVLAVGFGFGLGISYINHLQTKSAETDENQNLNTSQISNLNFDLELSSLATNTVSGIILSIDDKDLTIKLNNKEVTVAARDSTAFLKINAANLFNIQESTSISITDLQINDFIQITTTEDINLEKQSEIQAEKIILIEL